MSETNKGKGILWKIVDRYLVNGLSGMAMGLFSTLIVGLILKQIGSLMGDNVVGTLLVNLGTMANFVTGVGIGIGVAVNLKMPKLVVYSAGVAGFIGAYASQLDAGTLFDGAKLVLSGPGDPIALLWRLSLAWKLAASCQERRSLTS